LEENETELSFGNRDNIRKIPLTKIIIVSKESLDKLSLIKSMYSQLKKWNNILDQEFVLKFLLNNKSKRIIINQKKSSLDQLLTMVK